MSLNHKTGKDPLSRRFFLGSAVASLGVSSMMSAPASAQQAPGTTDRSNTATANPTGKRHITSVTQKKPYFSNFSGHQDRVDVTDFPILKGLSIRRLVLAPKGVREPHWHANANQLSYCLRGTHLVTIAGNHDLRNSFTIGPGEMFLVPSGAVHHTENIGNDEGEIIEAFSHEKPEDFCLSGTLGCFTDSVLGNTFALPSATMATLKRSTKDAVIVQGHAAVVPDIQDKEHNPYKYSLELAMPQINSQAGSAHTAVGPLWPALEDLAMFSVKLTNQGMRELHWHPETSEMGYITSGKGRMTIVSPGNHIDTFLMNPGDVYFIPPSYPHHFENLGNDDFKLIVFFDKRVPGDIGMATVVGDYTRDVLAATFDSSVATLPDFPFVANDLLIVPRINPIDPV